MDYPNRNRSMPSGGGNSKVNKRKGYKGGNFNEKTAKWPGTPGKTGPNRSCGVSKAPVYPKSEGI